MDSMVESESDHTLMIIPKDESFYDTIVSSQRR
jgi:hypothetical protein